jgi:hypothetical protein
MALLLLLLLLWCALPTALQEALQSRQKLLQRGCKAGKQVLRVW